MGWTSPILSWVGQSYTRNRLPQNNRKKQPETVHIQEVSTSGVSIVYSVCCMAKQTLQASKAGKTVTFYVFMNPISSKLDSVE